MIWEMLDKNLIVTGLQADTYEDVMENLGSIVVKEGYAKESYVNALKTREAEFPTGLNVDGIGVAIPHTAVEHVNKVGVAVAILEKPVTFIEMGSEDDEVEVQIVFMLAVVDPNAHLDQLQRIIGIIQDTEVLNKLLSAKDADDIIETLKEKEATM